MIWLFLERYTRLEFAESTGPGGANTRQIIHHFNAIEDKTCGEGYKMSIFLTQMGWTYSEYKDRETFFIQNQNEKLKFSSRIT